MRKLARNKIPFWIRLGIATGLTTWVLSFCLGFFPEFVERVYYRSIYFGIVAGLSAVSSRIPFSTTDLLHYSIPAILLAAFVFRYRKTHQKRQGVLALLAVAGFCYAAFLCAWGFNYQRPSLDKILEIPKTIPDDHRANVLKRIVAETNSLRQKVGAGTCFNGTLDQKTVDRKISELEGSFLVRRGLPIPGFIFVKPRLFSWLHLRLGNSGIYGPFTGEANITQPLPPGMTAFTVAHERAHRCGFASETDASVIALIALAESEEPELKYAGYLAFWAHVGSKERERLGLGKATEADLECVRNFWKQYPSYGLDRAWVFYDWYLKLQGQKRGMKSYADASEVALRYWASRD